MSYRPQKRKKRGTTKTMTREGVQEQVREEDGKRDSKEGMDKWAQHKEETYTGMNS